MVWKCAPALFCLVMLLLAPPLDAAINVFGDSL